MTPGYQFVLGENPEGNGDPLTIIAIYSQRVSILPISILVNRIMSLRNLFTAKGVFGPRGGGKKGGRHEGRDVYRIFLQEILVHVFSTGLEKNTPGSQYLKQKKYITIGAGALGYNFHVYLELEAKQMFFITNHH